MPSAAAAEGGAGRDRAAGRAARGAAVVRGAAGAGAASQPGRNQLRTELEHFSPGPLGLFRDLDGPISLASLERYRARSTRAGWASSAWRGSWRASVFRSPEARAAFRLAPACARGPRRRAGADTPPIARAGAGRGDQATRRPDQAARRRDRARYPRASDGEIFLSLFKDSVITAAELLSETGDCRARYPSRAALAGDAGQAAVAISPASAKRRRGGGSGASPNCGPQRRPTTSGGCESTCCRSSSTESPRSRSRLSTSTAASRSSSENEFSRRPQPGARSVTSAGSAVWLLSNESINKILVLLANILDTAVEHGLLASNPARGKRRRLKANRPIRRFLEADELAELLAVAGELDRSGRSDQRIGRRPLIAVMAKSGLRVGEVCTLRWRSVDTPHQRVIIEQAETAAGVREVDLSLDLVDELKPGGLSASPRASTSSCPPSIAVARATRTASASGCLFPSSTESTRSVASAGSFHCRRSRRMRVAAHTSA